MLGVVVSPSLRGGCLAPATQPGVSQIGALRQRGIRI